MGKDVELGDIDVRLEGAGTHDIDMSLDVIDEITTRVTLEGGKAIATDSTATLNVPEPVRTESKIEGGEPIRTDLSLDIKPLEASLDVKPLTADLCLNVGINSLPPTRICAPFSTHFGITLFGVEVLGFNLAGENRLQIEPLPTPPSVAWGGTHAAEHRPHPPPPRPHGDAGPRAEASSGGLRITLDG